MSGDSNGGIEPFTCAFCERPWSECQADMCAGRLPKKPTRTWWVLVNIAAIPYVWIRFPKEAWSYTRDCFRVLIHGRVDESRL